MVFSWLLLLLLLSCNSAFLVRAGHNIGEATMAARNFRDPNPNSPGFERASSSCRGHARSREDAIRGVAGST